MLDTLRVLTDEGAPPIQKERFALGCHSDRKIAIHHDASIFFWGMFAPGLVLGEDAGEVQGLVFTSGALPAHWSRLDAFEGEGHVRTLVKARLDNGATVQAVVYASIYRQRRGALAGVWHN